MTNDVIVMSTQVAEGRLIIIYNYKTNCIATMSKWMLAQVSVTSRETFPSLLYRSVEFKASHR